MSACACLPSTLCGRAGRQQRPKRPRRLELIKAEIPKLWRDQSQEETLDDLDRGKENSRQLTLSRRTRSPQERIMPRPVASNPRTQSCLGPRRRRVGTGRSNRSRGGFDNRSRRGGEVSAIVAKRCCNLSLVCITGHGTVGIPIQGRRADEEREREDTHERGNLRVTRRSPLTFGSHSAIETISTSFELTPPVVPNQAPSSL